MKLWTLGSSTFGQNEEDESRPSLNFWSLKVEYVWLALLFDLRCWNTKRANASTLRQQDPCHSLSYQSFSLPIYGGTSKNSPFWRKGSIQHSFLYENLRSRCGGILITTSEDTHKNWYLIMQCNYRGPSIVCCGSAKASLLNRPKVLTVGIASNVPNHH
jgi:hypothetical protein